MPTRPERCDLIEHGDAVEVELPLDVGIALAASGFVDAHPVPGTRIWSLKPGAKVGAVALAGYEFHVKPKITVDRLIALLEHSIARVTWRQDTVDVEPAPDLLTAVVEVYERVATQVLRQGLLQGYRVVEEALPVIRGRIREADQLRRRHGLPVPVEVRYDEFTPDTAENRLLRAAVLSARRLPGLSASLRHRLLRLDSRLADVTPVRTGALEPWRPNRLNARLHDALRVAEVVVRATSFEAAGTGLRVSGFVLDMAKVFEDFVCATLGARLRTYGGLTKTQYVCHLDEAGEVRMRPDLVWLADGAVPAAVVDAKYKKERPAGFPDADLYQMLAYCTALRLPVGHLVYAQGNAEARKYAVAGTDVELRAHTLNLSRPHAELLAEVERLADRIARTAPARAVASGWSAAMWPSE